MRFQVTCCRRRKTPSFPWLLRGKLGRLSVSRPPVLRQDCTMAGGNMNGVWSWSVCVCGGGYEAWHDNTATPANIGAGMSQAFVQGWLQWMGDHRLSANRAAQKMLLRHLTTIPVQLEGEVATRSDRPNCSVYPFPRFLRQLGFTPRSEIQRSCTAGLFCLRSHGPWIHTTFSPPFGNTTKTGSYWLFSLEIPLPQICKKSSAGKPSNQRSNQRVKGISFKQKRQVVFAMLQASHKQKSTTTVLNSPGKGRGFFSLTVCGNRYS